MNESIINADGKENLIELPWIEILTNDIPICESCLCLRDGRNICNLYYDGHNWLDDGYDSKNERIFNDVTHYIPLKSFKLPSK